MHEVESPAPAEIRNILTRGIDALESGKTSVGGYYYIKNIQKKNPNPQGAFLDVQIYTTSFNDNAALKDKFDGWNATANTVKCCWDSGMGATGIKGDFTGFARVVEYNKRQGAFSDVTATWDGALKQGERKGFGRYVNAEQRTSFIGPMDGDHATYKGLFYKDFEGKYIGVWSNSGSLQKYDARPSATFWFDDFSREPIQETEPEIDPDTGIRTWPDGSQTNADGTPVTDYYGDRREDYNAYTLDEYQAEQAKSESEPEPEPTPEEDLEGEDDLEGGSAAEDEDLEEEWVECEWDDDECWENLEYDWQDEDDDMFDWGDEWEEEGEGDWGEDYYYYGEDEEDWAWGEDDDEEWEPEYVSFFDDEDVGKDTYDTDDFAAGYAGWDDLGGDAEEEEASAGEVSGGEVDDPNDPVDGEDDSVAEEESESEGLSIAAANAEQQAFAAAAVLLGAPDFYNYGDNSYTWTA